MKVTKKILAVIMIAAMVVTMIPSTVEAKTTTKLNKKTVTLTITNTKTKPTTTLKIKGVSKKVAKKAKWTSSKKSVATVKRTSAGNGKITAKKAGTTVITCKVKGKKYKCKVKVVDKRTNSNSLNVTIKDLGEVSFYCPDPYKMSSTAERIQRCGYIGPYSVEDSIPESWDEDPTSPYSPENVNVYKTTRRFMFEGGTPYIVNSKIVVTYNGKDVTDKATYEFREADDEGTLPFYNDGTQIKDGIFPANSLTAVDGSNKNLKLVVTYKGMTKEIPMNITCTKRSVIMCYCGALFDKGSEHDDHLASAGFDETTTAGRRNETNCSGIWGMIYYVIDIKAK